MNRVEATIESLPEEVMELFGQYLSASDLASCCTVSRKWREIFGRNRLWRVHCDEALAEVVDESNSVVEPLFTSPLPDDTTLTSISEWRLNFMKQIRLRNNWSSGNFKMEQITCRVKHELDIKNIFFKDHYLLVFKRSELEVWDVSKRRKLKSRFHFHTYGPPRLDVFELKGSDKFVTVDGFVVRVYRLCCVRNSLELLHVFSFELTERCSENTEERAHELFFRPDFEFKTCTVVGNVFVGINTNQTAPKMHIWNVETGLKLKEEDCPFSAMCPWNKTISACEKSMNIILDGEERVGGKWVEHWYVYSLTNLKFFPFHQEHKALRYCCWGRSIIFDKYIALCVDNRSQVYNYLTSEIVYTAGDHYSWRNVLYFRNYIFYQNYNSFHVFNPRNPQNKIKPIECRHRKTEAVGNMAIVSFMSLSQGEIMSAVFAANKKIEDGSKSVSVPFYYLNDCDKYLINQYGTKLVLMKLGSTGNIQLQVVHFW